MPIGTVKFFNQSKGYGFIAPDGGGQDAFVHMSAVERAGMMGLRENQRISYDLEQDQRGKLKAANLRDANESAANDSGPEQDSTAGQPVQETAEITGIADAQASDEQPATQA